MHSSHGPLVKYHIEQRMKSVLTQSDKCRNVFKVFLKYSLRRTQLKSS